MSRFLLTVLALGLPAVSQGPAPGLRLIGHLNKTVSLVDTNGATVRQWQLEHAAGTATYLCDDGTLLRSIAVGPLVGNGAGGGIQRLAFDGTVLWDFRYNIGGVQSHHDLEALPNGNVLLIAWELKTGGEAAAAGRDPTLVQADFRPDHIVEIQPTGPTTGQVVWEWHVWDHLIQDFDPSQANFGDVAAHPELVDLNYPPSPTDDDGDWNHINGIDYDPIHDQIILSVPTFNEIWVIDHSTTTAQAAGHRGGRWGKGGDLLYRWGNPAAYRARGNASLNFQHAPTLVPPGYPGEGNLVVFNNRFGSSSAVFEIKPPRDASGAFVFDTNTGRFGPESPDWEYTAPDFFSFAVSSAARLPNGNTLICSGVQGWTFEVTPGRQRVWEHRVGDGTWVFHAHYVERSLWASDTAISRTRGGTIELDLLAGTDQAGRPYFVLASGAGTTPGLSLGGLTLPLNHDEFLTLSLTFPNSLIFQNTFGVIDANGVATARFHLPPGLAPASVEGQLHFAYGVVDGRSLSKVSNATPVSIER